MERFSLEKKVPSALVSKELMCPEKTEQIYKSIEDLIEPDWNPGRTLKKKHFRLQHIKLGEMLTDTYGTKLKAQFWMNADRKPLRLHFEIDGDFDERNRFTTDFKQHLNEGKPTWLKIQEDETKLTSIDIPIATKRLREYILYISHKIDTYFPELNKKPKEQEEDPKTATIKRMIGTIMGTIQQSGSTSEVTRKNKITNLSKEELELYIDELLQAQNGICALSNIRYILDGVDGSSDLRSSVDRIDSDLGYVRGNLQIVCQFINKWKSDRNNDDFIRLLNLIRCTESNQSG